MKLYCVLLLTLPLLAHGHPAQSQPKSQSSEDKSISLDDVAADSEHAESGSPGSNIQKRSGSFDYVAHLKSGLLSSIGQASASIASGSSGGSGHGSGHGGGGGGGGYHSHDSGHHGNSVDYDPWSFKKSVLNTIFQAVKAITGGVTALKGQLIKGGGHVLSASGNLVAAGGEKVTNVGKNIIHSAQINTHPYGHSGGGGGSSSGHGGGSVHPFAKFASLSGASSGGSSGGGGGGGGKHSSPPGPVIHTETITTYEIPSGADGGGAHVSYGPPSKAPTFSSATHQYLPPPSGGSPFGHGGGGGGHHAAFEAPQSNYLPTAYGNGYDDSKTGHDEFNIYGRHQQLNDADAKKAAVQLQEILQMLPHGKTEFTASKTVTLDTSGGYHTASAQQQQHLHPDQVELHTYGLPNDLGPLESLSHTAAITATYAPPTNGANAQHQQSLSLQEWQSNPSDIYHQMAKKQSPEETYIRNHPDEGYQDYPPSKRTETFDKYNNYHAANAQSALNDLTPIIAALEVSKRQHASGSTPAVSTHYTIERNVQRSPPARHAAAAAQHAQSSYDYLPPIVQKSKYTYFDPNDVKGAPSSQHPVYTAPGHPASPSDAYKVRRHVPPPPPHSAHVRGRQRHAVFQPQEYEVQDPLMFNRMFSIP